MSIIQTQFNVLHQISGDGVSITSINMIVYFKGVLPVAPTSNILVSVNFNLPSMPVIISQSLPASDIAYSGNKGSISLQGSYNILGTITEGDITSSSAQIIYISST